MEAGEESLTISSAFPRPPPFHEQFTPQNLARVRELLSRDGGDGQSPSVPLWQSDANGLDALPPELQFLIPPEPPASGTYRSFGETRDINDSLPILPPGIEQLFPAQLAQSDRAYQLLKLSKSLLLNFLELVSAFAANPELARPKIDDLRTILYNTHQLINEYRPHQARETLIAMMERRLEQKRSEVKDVKSMRARVDNLLAEIGERKIENGDDQMDEREKEQMKRSEKYRDEHRQIWNALNAIEL